MVRIFSNLVRMERHVKAVSAECLQTILKVHACFIGKFFQLDTVFQPCYFVRLARNGFGAELSERQKLQTDRPRPIRCVCWLTLADFDTVDQAHLGQQGKPQPFATHIAKVGSCHNSHQAVFVSRPVCCFILLRKPE